ncbi:MAG TPA: SDR family NAD(P)-dependent oxidoreductase [Holophagaceae bacterium]|nr:SDR family NAD(P)-dependent oxidoreductase [Holophagaceae bacterium]
MSTILVTGASRGIGKEISRRLAAMGHTVLMGARNAEAGERAADEVGGIWVALDVADRESIHNAADFVASEHGLLDALVNNAGILIDEGRSILDLDEATILETFRTNTLGPLFLAQAFAPQIPKGGRIINVSSAGGQLSSPSTWAPAYCLSKTALNAVTVQLAAALKGRGIAVFAACPGWVRTDMGGESAPRSVQQGADTPVWLATEAPVELSGLFIQDREVIPW